MEIHSTEPRLYINDFRLTTAEILYRLPDYPLILQTFLWQDMDLPPEFPQLKQFLCFWERSLDGKLYEVRVVSSDIPPRESVRCGSVWNVAAPESLFSYH